MLLTIGFDILSWSELGVGRASRNVLEQGKAGIVCARVHACLHDNSRGQRFGQGTFKLPNFVHTALTHVITSRCQPVDSFAWGKVPLAAPSLA